MLKVIIIDDEPKARLALRTMIINEGLAVDVVAEADGVESGLLLINKFRPDVILLDIKMKDGNGFDLIKKIVDVNCKIIFVTAFHEYAIKAFKFSAIDYLLKPVDADDLILSLKKAKETIDKEIENKQLEFLLANFNDRTKQSKKITLRTANSIYILSISDILYCKSDGNYTEFHCAGGEKFLVSKPIGDYEDMLAEYGFLRVHHSFLINIEHAIRFDKSDGGLIVLDNSEAIPVSARKREVLLDALNKL